MAVQAVTRLLCLCRGGDGMKCVTRGRLGTGKGPLPAALYDAGNMRLLLSV